MPSSGEILNYKLDLPMQMSLGMFLVAKRPSPASNTVDFFAYTYFLSKVPFMSFTNA